MLQYRLGQGLCNHRRAKGQKALLRVRKEGPGVPPPCCRRFAQQVRHPGLRRPAAEDTFLPLFRAGCERHPQHGGAAPDDLQSHNQPGRGARGAQDADSSGADGQPCDAVLTVRQAAEKTGHNKKICANSCADLLFLTKIRHAYREGL